MNHFIRKSDARSLRQELYDKLVAVSERRCRAKNTELLECRCLQ